LVHVQDEVGMKTNVHPLARAGEDAR
jgi:hypothetical protein